MATTYEYQPLSSVRSTRVVLLQPNPQHEADLYCTLGEINLDILQDNTTKYDALSYVWGAKKGTITIQCDDRTILVTPNCELALRYLRHPKRQVTLWIDAICINQDDLEERAQQVSIMSEIYSKASRVVIWLGIEERATSPFFTYAVCSNWLRGLQIRLARLRIGFDPSSAIFHKLALISMRCSTMTRTRADLLIEELFRLMRNEWSTRVWTVPELTLASAAIVKCGSLEVSCEALFAGLLDMAAHAVEHKNNNQTQIETIILEGRWNARHYFRKLHQASSLMWNSDTFVPMKLLERTIALMWSNNSSQELDKIFAIYPVLTAKNFVFPKVDYTESLHGTIAGFMLATLKRTETFWPAYLKRWRPLEDPDIASWLLNPSRKAEFMDLWDLSAGVMRLPIRHSILPPKWLDLSTKCRLYLKGKRVGVVSRTGPMWVNDRDVVYWRLRMFFEWICFWYCTNMTSGNRIVISSTVRLALEMLPFSPDSKNGRRHQKRAVKAGPVIDEYISACCETAATLPQDLDQLREAISASPRPVLSDKSENLMNGFFLDLLSELHTSKPFYLQPGFIGWAFAAVEEGDTIALVAGSDIPIILRPRGDDWRFIGPVVHVEGLMKGEQWPEDIDVDALETITLV